MTISRKRLSRLIRECAPAWEGILSGHRVRLEKVRLASGHTVKWSVCINRHWVGGDAPTIKDAVETLCAVVETRGEAK